MAMILSLFVTLMMVASVLAMVFGVRLVPAKKPEPETYDDATLYIGGDSHHQF